MDQLESQIAAWRTYVEGSPGVEGRDADELEGHLRDQIAHLEAAGLAADEAFLVAVKRLGGVHKLSREFAREHSGRLWKQLVLAGDEGKVADTAGWSGMLLVAVAAAVAIQIARLIAGFPADESLWLLRNLSVIVLPFLAGWFVYRRQLSVRQTVIAAAPFAVAAVLINLYPFVEVGSTGELVILHLPVLLWFAVAYPYMGGAVRSHRRRMDYVRFTGEWLIYFALMALGGGVLVGLTVALLLGVGVDPEWLIEWILPSGAAGAVIVAAWLVELKQRVSENMAPVLTMVFTPLFAVMLAVLVVVYAVRGLGGEFDRNLLAVFDVLLIVVLGLVLYGISARHAGEAPNWMDRIQFMAVLGALVLDVMVLGSMLARIGDLGFTANRTAALGLNLVLLADLAGAAWLSLRYLTGKVQFPALGRWQTTYLPVFAIWAAVVVVIFPPLFSFR